MLSRTPIVILPVSKRIFYIMKLAPADQRVETMTESRMHLGAYVELPYEEYQRPVLAYLTRLVSDREAAEDLCQETFIKAMRGWEGRDPSASVAAWIYRIATNTAYDYLRRR